MEICRQAFEKDLMAAIDKDAEAKKVQVKVETRNFEYEPDEGEIIADNHKMVSIWIGLYMGESTQYMTDEFESLNVRERLSKQKHLRLLV